MKIQFIKSGEKKELLKELNEEFGISNLPFLLFEAGKEKTRAYTGSLSKDEILDLAAFTHIEFLGFYLLRKENIIRLSIEGTHSLKEQISKNIINISDSETIEWFRGLDLQIKEEKGVKIIQNGSDFLGSGISTGECILNHVPKERRLKN